MAAAEGEVGEGGGEEDDDDEAAEEAEAAAALAASFSGEWRCGASPATSGPTASKALLGMAGCDPDFRLTRPAAAGDSDGGERVECAWLSAWLLEPWTTGCESCSTCSAAMASSDAGHTSSAATVAMSTEVAAVDAGGAEPSRCAHAPAPGGECEKEREALGLWPGL